MGLLDTILLRLGLVRVKRYGLVLSPDGRLLSAPQLEADYSAPAYLPPAPAVDLLRPDGAARRLARGSMPPPVPGAPTERNDLTMLNTGAGVTTPQPVPSSHFAPASPDPAEPKKTPTRPDATALGTQSGEEDEWERKLAEARTAPTDEVDRPNEEEDWEWKLAMARAKAQKTEEVARPKKLAEGSGPTPRVSAPEAAKPVARSRKPTRSAKSNPAALNKRPTSAASAGPRSASFRPQYQPRGRNDDTQPSARPKMSRKPAKAAKRAPAKRSSVERFPDAPDTVVERPKRQAHKPLPSINR